jgi:hypothetical protein
VVGGRVLPIGKGSPCKNGAGGLGLGVIYAVDRSIRALFLR